MRGSEIGWEKKWQWALEITEGLNYLHEIGMLHRDLKCDNILLDGLGRAKLGDLGVSQVDSLFQKNEQV
uniref:Protein kinase domain-containing protein n=1 Tax=Arcella intermedia TaxID=1963864 RepID=A0A6B2LXJ2_9EUKA